MVNVQEQALGFLESQIAHIERDVYKIRYPSIQYHQLIPVSTEAHEWARTITYYSMDMVGRADFFAAQAQDMPVADVSRTQYNVNAEMLGIGYQYNLEELGQAMMVPGTNLTSDRASAARRAAEERFDDIALRGDESMGWDGLINAGDDDPADGPVAHVAAAATGTSSSTFWANKTAENILADINNALTMVYESSRQVEYADTLLLPVAEYTRLISRRNSDSSDKTIMEFLMSANVYTGISGRPLMVRMVRGLENAAPSNQGRAIVYRRSPEVLKFHVPMRHRFLDVWRNSPANYLVPGIMRTAGVEIRLPGAVRYLDGINATPA